jgi:hypothetical protein
MLPAEDDLYLVAVTFSAASSASVGLGASVLIFMNEVTAEMGGNVTAGGDINVNAASDEFLLNIAASVSVGGNAGVGGAAVVTYFTGKTIARVLAGAVAQAAGNMTVIADSKEFITADVAGVSGGGTAGVSGAVDIVITEVVTRAYTENATGTADGVRITAGSLIIKAVDNYEFIGVSVTAAIGGTAGVGVNAMLTIAGNTVTAYIGEGNRIKTDSGDVTVLARSNRDLKMYAGTLAGGGTAGVGVTLMVAVIGGMLDEDTSGSLQTGKDKDGNEVTTFDPQALMTDQSGSAPGVTGKYYEDFGGDKLAGKLEGDGSRASGNSVGHKVHKKDKDGNLMYDEKGNPIYELVFDGETGYRDDSLTRNMKMAISRQDFEADENANDDLNNAAIWGPPSPVMILRTPPWPTSVKCGGGKCRKYQRNAYDNMTADMVTATVAGGAYAGSEWAWQ